MCVGMAIGVSFGLASGVLADKPLGSELPWQDARMLADVLERVKHDYVSPVDDHHLLQAAIRGMVSSLDPYSAYLDGDEYDEVKSIFSRSQFTPVGFGPSLDQMLADHPKGRIWARRRQLSAVEVVRNEFTSRHVQAFMLWMAFQTNQAVDMPGSGVLAYSLVFGRQQRSWSILPGGSGTLVGALVRYLVDHGSTVACGQIRVTDETRDSGPQF